MTDKHGNELDPCTELQKAKQELDAFLRECEKRIAFLNGVITAYSRLCQAPVDYEANDDGNTE